MGLGKTLQVIALLLWDKEDRGQKPSLAVVPTSLVYNWEDEVKKFAPELKTLALVGTKEERMEKLKDIEGADLVITSYPLIRRDGDELGEYSFRYCILDEAQHIKNPDSQNAKMVKSIKAEARFALTGTPMENNLTELWSIFDFIMPGYLYSQTKFRRQFESPIIRDRDERAAKRLSFHIKPFILRRLKGDVLKELPEKIEHRVTAELTVDQRGSTWPICRGSGGHRKGDRGKGLQQQPDKDPGRPHPSKAGICHPPPSWKLSGRKREDGTPGGYPGRRP